MIDASRNVNRTDEFLATTCDFDGSGQSGEVRASAAQASPSTRFASSIVHRESWSEPLGAIVGRLRIATGAVSRITVL
jgi:hypothetical protein